MTDSLSTGENVCAGRYICTTCGYLLMTEGPVHLDPCPDCHNHHWIAQSGGVPLPTDGDPFYEGC